MARIPSVITNQGEQIRNLSEERRNKWISAISQKDLTENILDYGQVCGGHFISGKAAKLWDRYDPDWIPKQNLGHDKCDSVGKLQADLEAAAKRDKRARDREKKRVAAENEKRLQEEIDFKRQKMVNQGKRPWKFLSIATLRWKWKLKRGQQFEQRRSTIYFTPRMSHHHSTRLNSQMTTRRFDFTLNCLLMMSCKQFYRLFRNLL